MTPTMELRFERRVNRAHFLQQKWVGDDGKEVWKDVPVVDQQNPPTFGRRE